jgi:Phage P22-like portal protein
MDEQAKEGGAFGVTEALAMYEDYKNAWTESYRQARIDIKMALGDRDVQWGAEWDNFSAEPGTPYVVINQLPQFIHQVTNDIRLNTPSIRILPDVDSNEETAEAISELIRAIEYKSNADEVYDTAAQYSVTCSIGFIRVDHDYCDDRSGNQEVLIDRVNDPLSIFIDPSSVECDGRDAMGAIALETVTRKDFKKRYPGKEFISFSDPKDNSEKRDTIVIGEVFIKEVAGEKPNQQITIRRYKFSGHDLLEETVFPGNYIPIIPVYGVEVWVDGKRNLLSLIRQARDPQRRLNHWASKESQILSMAPISPIIAVRNTIANERGQYQRPGKETVLEYDQLDDNGQPAPPPRRLESPSIPTGIINAMQGAKEGIKESIGMYAASLGTKSNVVSGVAYNAQKQEGDVATLHFADNLRRSITHVGRVIVGMIPVIYDTPRVLQLVNNETDPKLVGVNGAMVEGQEEHIDLTKGTYHVRVTTGASYTTKRQETAAFLSDMFKQNPELLKIGGDILFKNIDMSGAEAMSERFKKMLPPELQEESKDPRLAQMETVMKQQQEQIMRLSAMLQEAKQAIDSKDGERQVKIAELVLKEKELDIKGQEIALKYQPQGNTEEMLTQHVLSEQAADNQLKREIYANVIRFGADGSRLDGQASPTA